MGRRATGGRRPGVGRSSEWGAQGDGGERERSRGPGGRPSAAPLVDWRRLASLGYGGRRQSAPSGTPRPRLYHGRPRLALWSGRGLSRSQRERLSRTHHGKREVHPTRTGRPGCCSDRRRLSPDAPFLSRVGRQPLPFGEPVLSPRVFSSTYALLRGRKPAGRGRAPHALPYSINERPPDRRTGARQGPRAGAQAGTLGSPAGPEVGGGPPPRSRWPRP
jgi:hypothetical protein